MKKTFEDLLEIDGVVAQLYTKEPTLKESKFGYAYNRFHAKNYAPTVKEFQEALTYARIDNALEDEKTKALLTDEKNTRGYQFSKEGLKNCIKAENKIIEEFYKKEIEIIPFFSPFIPEGITETQIETLKGCVLE